MADTLRKWVHKFNIGDFDAQDVHTQIEAGWYDWFCADKSLAKKTKVLGNKVKKIAKSSKINLDTMFVFFKNNCPMSGSLYDDFRICDMESGDVIWTVTPKSGRKDEKGQANLYGIENNFNGPIVEGTWKDVLAYFGV